MKFEKFNFLNNVGKKIKFTCDNSKLANNFGSNPKSPSFLTLIFFKREVLDKYYNYPSKYSINDGYLLYKNEKGINVWGMPIDNNQGDCIGVYLGDLAKLPYEEQQYWKLFNILKRGKVSKTSFKRDFEAKFCSPEEPVLFFKERLSLFNSKWNKKFGWFLFKPLNAEDEHHWKSLKIPAEEQKEFDEKILSLTKILIESLNIDKMKENLNYKDNEKNKSISIFDKYLEQKHKFKSHGAIQYLKDLQELRSKGSAHRKSRHFQKNYKKFDKGSFSETFKQIVIGAITLLNTLENNLLK
jgi:hypothetical protein